MGPTRAMRMMEVNRVRGSDVVCFGCRMHRVEGQEAAMSSRLRMASRLSLLVLVISGLNSCDEDAAGPAWSPEVEGTWQWARSVVRTTGEVLSPSSGGYTATLRLLPDAPSHPPPAAGSW